MSDQQSSGAARRRRIVPDLIWINGKIEEIFFLSGSQQQSHVPDNFWQATISYLDNSAVVVTTVEPS